MLNNDYDFKILKYISNFEQIEEAKLLDTFSNKNFAIKGRLKYLKMEKFIDKFPKITFLDGNDKPNYYVITDLGNKAIQDYILNKKHIRKTFCKDLFFALLHSILCPIIVAFITALITIWLKEKYNIF